MKRLIIIAFLCAALAAPLVAQESSSKRGIVFGFANVLQPTGFADAYQSGVGLKLWLDPENAIRGVVRLAYTPAAGAGDPSTDIGLGAAYERHFGSGPVTPYLGGFAGTSIFVQGGSDISLYFGGVLGGEMPVLDNLNIFGEYDLRFLVDDVGLSVDNVANFGFILYFN
jgi:hypothetical protein